jgi:phage tail sheath gpL-like
MSPINTTVPSSIRRPGAFHEFRFNAAGQQLASLDLRLVIVAEKTAAGTAAADTPVQIFDELDSETKLGAGSFADLGAKKALAQGKLNGGGSPEVWACPVAENAAGTATQHTLTVSGPATEAGTLLLRAAGRTVDVGVSNGDSADTIAAAIKTRLDELAASLPFTAGVALAVVTTTNRTKGVNGNDVAFEVVSKPAGVGVVIAQSVAGAGATAITAALAALYDQRYHVIALANHAAGDGAVVLADAALAWGFNQKSYRFYVMGERGSLGTATTLQDSFNDYRAIIASYEGTPSLPIEIAVAVAVRWFGVELPNSNMNHRRLDLYPPAAASAYTATEIESALAGGGSSRRRSRAVAFRSNRSATRPTHARRPTWPNRWTSASSRQGFIRTYSMTIPTVTRSSIVSATW